MRKLPLVAIALIATAPIVMADTHDWGTTGVSDTGIVTNILQLTYGTHATPPVDGAGDAVPCWPTQPWSADGRRIVFQSQIGGTSSANNEICVINRDGTGFTRLTDDGATPVCDSHAMFMPGEAQIVYQRYHDSAAEIWLMNADGSNPHSLSQAHVDNPESPAGDGQCENKPLPSPDGAYILFHSCSEELWIMNADGTDPRRLSRAEDTEADHYTWSPDSQWVAYKATDSLPAATIRRVRPDGTDNTLVADHSSVADGGKCANWPSWSPNGSLIAYHTCTDDASVVAGGIWVVDPFDPSTRRMVATGDGDEEVCGPSSWTPNSQWIAFKKDPDPAGSDAARAIYVTNIATGETHQLTDGFWDYRQWFSPDGAAILFKDRGGATRDANQWGNDLLVVNINPVAAEMFGGAPQSVAVPSMTWAALALLVCLIAAVGGIALRRS